MPRIVTNNQERPLIGWDELTDKERKWFDASQPDSLFFRYRGWVYDYYEMPMAPDSLKALGWDGALADTVWTAIIVRYFDRDGYALDGVIVGYYIAD